MTKISSSQGCALQENFSTPPKDRKQQSLTNSVSSQLIDSEDTKMNHAATQDKMEAKKICNSSNLPSEVLDVIHFLNCIEKRLEGCKSREEMTSFHSVCRPSICIGEYVRRIADFARCNPRVFILAIIYMDRIVRIDDTLEINNLTIHRLVISAVVVASKYLEDRYHSNATFARIGGTSGEELNLLELEFVFRLKFELHVSMSCFESYAAHISEFRRNSPSNQAY
eukprot:CAMPEP_0185273068 /NCGR_PEP_ID=MMETSP1359-20130426/48692_1 /TAXON_ID=552665 /ORGANISM="Bigelowiella longifila, Strain CCMP242" /LENGTH=224 /DNA_ID=CAMNT_0027865569 /DNA_START=125 /DNA_END=799 /DNA_ORIENTATION=-